MAKKAARPQNTGTVGTSSFDKGLQEDIKDFHLSPNMWTQARNAINNSQTGDIGDLGNEPGNRLCARAPYTIIGTIHIEADRWAIFSTNNVDSEIGVFEEDICEYRTVVNAPCLNFNTNHLIIGEAREIYDCTFQVYWDDGENPSRTMNLTNVPWIQNCSIVSGCEICEDTDELDCDKIRLAPLVTPPCFTVKKGASGGSLFNGSYFVVAAYTENDQRITDYSTPSNIQPIFHHSGTAGSIDIEVVQMDDDYEEFELILVSIVNQTTAARRVGTYSTRQKRITIDIVDSRWPNVGIDLISLRNPIVDKSDAMYTVNNHLIRVGPTNKLDFNYQPLANQISAKWVSIEYDKEYYEKGGSNTGYMRDEVYPFFVRFVWDTGDKTPSFHIPGIYADPTGPQFDIVGGSDALIDVDDGITPYRWRVFNSATVTALSGTTLPDGGVVVGEGNMGYWESTELYDDDKPEIWNANVVGQPGWDLCGKPIRHHRFPDNATHTGAPYVTNHFAPGGEKIRVMGVRFENIQPPVDLDGNIIPNIVGYEILRGTREGNKSVIAKGILNNMFEYDIPDDVSNRQGLYPNYPYNDLNADPFLSTTQTDGTCGPSAGTYNPITEYSKKHFTFHSPETQFKDPLLDMEEIKVYGTFTGLAEGGYVEPEKHPKHKFLTDFAFIASVVGGIGAAIIAMSGKRKVNHIKPQVINLGGSGTFTGVAGVGTWATPGISGVSAPATALIAIQEALMEANESGADTFFYNVPLQAASTIFGATNDGYYSAREFSWGLADSYGGYYGGLQNNEQELGPMHETKWLNVLNSIPTFSYYFSEGADAIINLIMAASKYRQFALQYQSHCWYNQFLPTYTDNHRRGLNTNIYLSPHFHDFGSDYRINNLKRGRAVALEVDYDIGNPINPTGIPYDNTRQSINDITNGDIDFLNVGDPLPDYENPYVAFNTRSAVHYAALKQRIRNQYGQIENIIQVPTYGCISDISESNSPVIFGGDIYIGRHTEKNTFFYFQNWLLKQPDGAAFNYKLNQMIPHPTYWADTDKFDINDFTRSLMEAVTLTPPSVDTSVIGTPSNFRVFDRDCSTFGSWFHMIVRNAYFYLFNSGVRDFFVESEINVDLRDWEDEPEKRHYDPYESYGTGLRELFDMDIIAAGNFYKYDYSLSISKIYNNYISWGNTHLRSYDPLVAEQCYLYRPDRVMYSLQSQEELLKDYWKVFLPNNYKDFKSRVTAFKSIGGSGSVILFENEAPAQIKGVDELQTSAGVKLTIGDGGLFTMPIQNVVNSDRPYEYGSCQNRLSAINTPAGLFWMSQNQGKIFQLGKGIKEISMKEMKWWFTNFLPYKLTEQFPDFELTDNPIDGIGCQAIYDNENSLVYFCKRDYVLRDDIQGTITYDSGNIFLLNNRTQIRLGDPRYFRPASWTVSYDPKQESWLSYHDWHPNLLMPGKKTFMSILDEGIWIHNDRCDLYCNFYGENYPFEIEYTVNTIQEVNTLRSVQYQLEAYRYDPANCYDRFHDLDFNFDEAVIYNTEQCSGLLRMTLSPKGNAPALIQYPIINPTWIDILYSKEEQKYRFNEFWDITQDRGEFNPAAERVIWNTEPNGYIRNLNPNNLNYSKEQTQRKKFRHYTNTVLLRRRVSGDRKILVQIANNKNLRSPR